MKATGLVLKSRAYTSPVEPPDSLEDESRFGNDGVHTDITWVKLPSGLWVRSFNGSSSRFILARIIVLEDDKPWTLSVWVYKDSALSRYLYGNTLGAGSYTRMWFHENYLIIYNDVGAFVRWLGYPVPITAWVHLVVTCDGTNTNNMELFYNAISQGIETFADSSQTIRVFGESGGGSFWLDGDVALLRIYNYALSPTSIYKHFQAERSLFGV